MKVNKKLAALICLSSMMLGFNSLSSQDIKYSWNIKSIDSANINEEEIYKEEMKVVKNMHYENLQQIAMKEHELQEQRQSAVTYERADITVLSGVTEQEMKVVLENTTSAHTMSHLAKAFVDCEKLYGVNAFTMAGIVALESSYATSRRAVEDNNLTGYEVYSDSSEGRLFKSQYDSIVHTAEHLKKNYLTEGSIYYNGVSVDAVQIMYCPDEGKGKNWEGKVDKLASRFLSTYKQLYVHSLQ